MTQEQIIADYKKARHITDEYVLDEDEMYFVEQIYLLHQEQVKNCSIHDVSGCFTADDMEECYNDGYETEGEITFDINNYR